MIKSLFSLALTCFKLEDMERASEAIKEGMNQASILGDEIYQLKFQFLQALYIETDSSEQLRSALLGLRNKKCLLI